MNDEEQKKVFSYNLNFYLQHYQKTQKEVADAIEVSPQTFNTWCKGIALPRMGKVQRLADYFRIGKTELLDPHPVMSISSVCEAVTIPVFERIVSCSDHNITGSQIATEEFSKAAEGRYFGLKVSDTSMEPRLMAGDLVIACYQNHAASGDLIVALWNQHTIIRRLITFDGGRILLANNAAFDPLVLPDGQARTAGFQIVGRVVEMRVKL